eukprot:tig00021254_g19713.t1
MEYLGLPGPPDVSVVAAAGATRRIAYPLPLGPEDALYLSAYPSALKNVTGEAYQRLRAEGAASRLGRLEQLLAGNGSAPVPLRTGVRTAASAVAAAMSRAGRLALRDLMGGAMEYAEVLADPSLFGYARDASAPEGYAYSPELARQQAQRVILESTAFTGRVLFFEFLSLSLISIFLTLLQVRNIEATALFSNLYFANFYTNRRKVLPTLPSSDFRLQPFGFRIHARRDTDGSWASFTRTFCATPPRAESSA